MKLQIKFDKKAALGFISQYGERVVFACVVLCFLFFVYASFARERYDKTPQEIDRTAQSATDAINSTEPGENQELKDYGKTIEEISNPLDMEPYVITKPFNPPIFEPRSKRGLPMLFTVEKLRAVPGCGRLEKSMAGAGRAAGIAGGGGGGLGPQPNQEIEPLGSRWVMLTGLVDLKKQIEAFRESYKDAVYKTQLDQAPQYVYYWVERAEVPNTENPDDLQWERPYGSLNTEFNKYGGIVSSGGSDGYVAPDFIETALVFPLPKRLDEDWDESAAHPPQIPILGFDDEAPVEVQEVKPEQTNNGADDPDAFLLDPRGRGAGDRMGMGRPGMAPGLDEGMPGRFGGAGARGRFMAGQSDKEPSPYRLFRFIDFNVEPGKHYKYRVRLGFYNPNYEVEPRYLIPELQQLIAEDKTREASKKKWKRFVESDWSEPTDVVAVPRDDQLLLVSVEPVKESVPLAKKIDSEPEAKVMAVHWDMLNGTKVCAEFEDVYRGMVANFLDHKISPSEPPGGPGGMGPGGGGLMPPEGPGPRGRPPARTRRDRRNNRETQPLENPRDRMAAPGIGGGAMGNQPVMPEKVDFETECLVLDIRGGERLAGKNRELAEPGEMLLLDADGNIGARSDVEDFEQYRKNKFPPQQDIRTRGTRGGMDRGGPDMDLHGPGGMTDDLFR